MFTPKFDQRTFDYCQSRDIDFRKLILLGFGEDGEVWGTDRPSAIKVFEREENFITEVKCYQRLQERNTFEIDGFTIPCLHDFDDQLLVIEIDIVSRPCIVDFGKAYLDRNVQHTPEVLADVEESKREMWGPKIKQVRSILWQLKRIGIYYTDPNPRNFMFFENEPEDAYLLSR